MTGARKPAAGMLQRDLRLVCMQPESMVWLSTAPHSAYAKAGGVQHSGFLGHELGPCWAMGRWPMVHEMLCSHRKTCSYVAFDAGASLGTVSTSIETRELSCSTAIRRPWNWEMWYSGSIRRRGLAMEAVCEICGGRLHRYFLECCAFSMSYSGKEN